MCSSNVQGFVSTVSTLYEEYYAPLYGYRRMRSLIFTLHSSVSYYNNTQHYATLYFSGDNFLECIFILQRNLASLRDFFMQRGLSISPSKSKLVIFPISVNELPDDFVITIDDQLIYPPEDTKFLDLYFNSNLSWESNFLNLISRGQQILDIIKYLCGICWGSNPRILLLLFCSLAKAF